MKIVKLLPLLALAACADNTATKQQSVQIFAAASTALTSAQAKAVDQAKATHLVKPTDVTLDYTGPCTLGGSLGRRRHVRKTRSTGIAPEPLGPSTYRTRSS